MLGAITINTIVTFGGLIVVLVVGAAAWYPDIPVVPLVALSVAVALVVPVVFYPFSYTIWAAIELQMRPLEPDEVADAAAAVRATNGDA